MTARALAAELEMLADRALAAGFPAAASQLLLLASCVLAGTADELCRASRPFSGRQARYLDDLGVPRGGGGG